MQWTQLWNIYRPTEFSFFFALGIPLGWASAPRPPSPTLLPTSTTTSAPTSWRPPTDRWRTRWRWRTEATGHPSSHPPCTYVRVLALVLDLLFARLVNIVISFIFILKINLSGLGWAKEQDMALA